MMCLVVRSRVKDFEKWKKIFDEHASTRRRSGSKGGFFFRNADTPDETMFLFEWDSFEGASGFASDASVHSVLMQAGLKGQLNCLFP